MGQYYKVFNATKGEFISPYDFGSLYKLMESCYVGNEYGDALTWLLTNDWRGDCVFLCGDYAWGGSRCSGEDFLKKLEADGVVTQDPWELAESGVYASARECVGNRRRGYRYVANATRGVFYDREALPEIEILGDGWEVDPLTIYLACGNGLGCGDYCGEGEEEVGTWAGETVYGCDERPEGFTEILPPFKELA